GRRGRRDGRPVRKARAGQGAPGRAQCRLARTRACPRGLSAAKNPGNRSICMSVDAATVKRIGRLARIRVEENEVEKYQGEINAILGFVEQLGEVNVEGVEPMTSVTPMQLRRRDDVVTDGGYPEKVVANAPLTEDTFFMVPKVIE